MKPWISACVSLAFLTGVPIISSGAPAKPPAKGSFDKTAPPQDAFGVFSFDKAKAEADKKKRPLAFLVMAEKPDDTVGKAAVNRAYWSFADDAVVVVLRITTATDWHRLPDAVQAALKSPDLGKDYPKLLGFDEAGTVALLGMASAKIIASDEKALTKIAQSLRNLDKTKAPSTEFPPPAVVAGATPPAATPPTAAKPAAAPAAPEPAAVPAVILIKGAQPESWTNAEGKAIQATLAEVAADKVVFIMPNGAHIDYAIAKLSDASKKRVEELKTASTPH